MRKWKIKLQFENGRTHFDSFTLTDIAALIKDSKNKEKAHQTLPLDKWIVAMVFDKATHTCPIAELTNASIIQEG